MLLAASTFAFYRDSRRTDLLGMLIAYLVCETALGHWLIGISSRRPAQ
jgi:hypothetical protein